MIFETDRLIIRDYNIEDIEIVHELVQDPEIYKYQHWGPSSKKDTKNFIEMSLIQQKENPRKFFEMAITEKFSNDIIGAIGIRIRNHNKADIGYWIKYSLWGKGLATEATKEIINFGFKKLNLNKIFATASPENIGSLRVLEKVGMEREGYLKSDLLIRGQYRDSVLMGILKS